MSVDQVFQSQLRFTTKNLEGKMMSPDVGKDNEKQYAAQKRLVFAAHNDKNKHNSNDVHGNNNLDDL